MATLTNVKAYLTYHAFSEFLIYPYSSSHSKEAANKDELELVAQNMVSAIREVHGHTYGHGEGAPAFGVASGGSDDWAHDSGIPLRNVFDPIFAPRVVGDYFRALFNSITRTYFLKLSDVFVP